MPKELSALIATTKQLTPGVLLRVVLLCSGIVFLGMIPFSFRSYTSIGVDFEHRADNVLTEYLYRIRWPGDGSFRCGYGSRRYHTDNQDSNRIDLAGRFFRPPKFKPDTYSWVRFAIKTNVPEDVDAYDQKSKWLLVPSWFAALVVFAYPLLKFLSKTPSKTAPGKSQAS